jgi:hypothetical protein
MSIHLLFFVVYFDQCSRDDIAVSRVGFFRVQADGLHALHLFGAADDCAQQ